MSFGHTPPSSLSITCWTASEHVCDTAIDSMWLTTELHNQLVFVFGALSKQMWCQLSNGYQVYKQRRLHNLSICHPRGEKQNQTLCISNQMRFWDGFCFWMEDKILFCNTHTHTHIHFSATVAFALKFYQTQVVCVCVPGICISLYINNFLSLLKKKKKEKAFVVLMHELLLQRSFGQV